MDPQIVEIYTDGSCHTQHGNGAWASVIVFAGEKTVLTGEELNTTHNRMELLSVIESIDYCDGKHYGGQVTVYTDSQYVFLLPERKEKLKRKKFLTNKGNPIQNADLVQTLIGQIESHPIVFVKVKAHQGKDDASSKYNDQVDKLSRKLVRDYASKQAG